MTRITKHGYLDLVGIIFSLSGLLFFSTPFTDIDALWCTMIIIGFLMWGVQALPLNGRWNIPVRYPDYTPRATLWYGTLSSGSLSVSAVVVWVLWGAMTIPEILLPTAAIMTGWRVFSLYARGLIIPPHSRRHTI